MSRILSITSSLVLLASSAFAGDIAITVTGTVGQNSYGSGPFAGASAGDTAILTFEVSAIGVDVLPGQLTNYAIDLPTFDLDINGSTGAALGGATNLQIQDNLPMADGFRIDPTQLATGHFFECGWGTGPGFFSTTDITLLDGTYNVAVNLTSFGYTINGQGGSMEISPETLVIGGPSVGTSYCAAAPTSVSSGALISATGSASIAANDLELHCSGVVNGEAGVFYFGPSQIQTPFGDGFRCVGGAVTRLWPPIFASGGEYVRAIDNTVAPSAGVLVPMSTHNFQCWFRDPAGGPNGFNLSDGLEITFVP